MASPIDTFAPVSSSSKAEDFELSLNFGEMRRKNSRINDNHAVIPITPNTPVSPIHEVKVIDFNFNKYEETKSPFLDNWTVRQAFIRNVYFIISFQNLFSFLLSTCVAESFLLNNQWLKWICLITFVICLLPMLCVKSLRSSVSGNSIILAIFTITKSFYVAFMASESYRPDLEQTSCLVIGYIFLGLAFLNHQNRRDLSIFTEIIFIFVLYLACASTIAYFSDTLVSKLLSNSFWNTLLSIFFALDTHLIVEIQERNYELTTNDYVFVSLLIYLDIVKAIGLVILIIFMIIFNIFTCCFNNCKL